MPTSRRSFLKWSAGAAGAAAVPASILKALSIPANRATGTIQDVEHVVILMQENRSFDHYFGTMRGVRGFGDPRPMPQPNGKSVWHQPPVQTKTKYYRDRGLDPAAEYVLPWYLNPQRTTEYQAGTDHGWSSGHQAWNNGKYNQWIDQKQDVLTMGYLKRQDVSFHYALADAFTLCDAYHCSVHANTVINRFYLWTGTCDPRNIYGPKKNGPGLDERGGHNGYSWTTYPERLEEKKISWRVYQGGTGIPGDKTDNYTDNSLEFFSQYQVSEGAAANSSLVQNGVSNHTLREFRKDCESGTLPQVTWIVAPYKYCEHPEASPTDGAYYINLVLEALTANPEIWSKTVFLINYDENDGLFDHVVPPMPPHTREEGLVSENLVDGLKDEFLNLDLYPSEMHPIVPGSDPGGMQPIGLGPRVPMLVISPWSKGGWVCSQIFDHTSVLQFLEKRFGVEEPNISTWRRSVCGDLTTAFDFSKQDQVPVTSLVVPKPLLSEHKPYHVPMPQQMPIQEEGIRPARPLPYEFLVFTDITASEISLHLQNDSAVGVPFYVHHHADTAPKRYTVSAKQGLTDHWPLQDHPYYLAAYGPNGSLFAFAGSKEHLGLDAHLRYDASRDSVLLLLKNQTSHAITFHISNAYGEVSRVVTIKAGTTVEDRWNLAASAGWFDLSVTLGTNANYLRRFAGHLETGKPSTSDPLLGKAKN